MVCSVAYARTAGPGDTPSGGVILAWFRREFYASLTARADALFELTDAVLCADGPVTSLVELTLIAEHRRGHGAMYDALNAGRVEPRGCAGRWHRCRCPRWVGGSCSRSMSARGCARTRRPARIGCSATSTAAARGKAQMIPGWPYSFVAALETGRSRGPQCWTRCGSARPTTPPRSPPTQLRDVDRPADRGRALAARRPPHRDRGRHRLRHHPARLRPGRPAGRAGRAAALRPGAAPAEAATAARDDRAPTQARPGDRPGQARAPGRPRSTPPAPTPPATAPRWRPAGTGSTPG